MLSVEKNELLTRVGPDEPMGRLLRRYWMPIAAVSEFKTSPIRPIRLLGEDLVLYRDKSGTFGLVERQCAHRRADLSYGFVEEHGIRCNYHGWLYDQGGRCTHAPYEDAATPQAKLKDKVSIKAYPVEVKAGLVWTYMGPQPAPLVPDWEPFHWANGFRQIVIAEVPCNWFQCQENSIDPVHFEWMHTNWSRRQQGDDSNGPAHIKVDFEEFEHGLIYRRIREDTTDAHSMWTVGRVCLWPNGFFLGDHFEWRVPIDDENTLSVAWIFSRVPNEQEPYVQDEIPAWRGPVKDPETGRWIASHVMNQDFVAWVGQGAIADRTREHLGASDRGIAMLRRQFFNEIDKVVRDEGDPKGVIRDPAANVAVPLPIAERDLLVNGLPRERLAAHPIFGKHLTHFVFQAGQPDEVRDAYRAAMGLDAAE